MSIAESTPLELAPLRNMLRMYCHALSEHGIELQDLQQLVDKNIGWSRSDVATSDGSAIFLPAIVDRYAGEVENFEFLKVMLTQQAGHIEFGSFDFQFDKPSTLFDDWRRPVAAQIERESGADGVVTPTELSRFFKLCSNKRLAFDIFSIAESVRVESRIMREYWGIAPVYENLRRKLLPLRQELTLLPVRENLLELMIRVSLGQRDGLHVPTAHQQTAARIFGLLQLLSAPRASVEDAAEATLRIYTWLSRLPNDYLTEDKFTTLRFETDWQAGFEQRDLGGRWHEDSIDFSVFTRPVARGRERDYLSPQGVDYRGEFNPELAQLFNQVKPNSREHRKVMSPEELAQLLRNQKGRQDNQEKDEGEEQDPQTKDMVQNLMRELDRRDPRMQSVQKKPLAQLDDDAGQLSANQPNTYVYDEWDVFTGQYRSRWCKLYEKIMPAGDLTFYRETLLRHAALLQQIRREFEMVVPELYHKEKRLPDGSDHDLDLAIEAMTDLRIGVSPSEKIFWRHHKSERDVAVAFLLDMSGSTGEAINTVIAPNAAEGRLQRTHRRIIDVEKEAMVLMMDALETIGNRYGVYGFSGHGRDNVEYFVVKDIDEEFSLDVAKRVGRIGPLHATRMGPAIRHVTARLRLQQSRSRFLIMISDGRPQDRGYSQESSEKAYAVQDTRMAFIEARREGIHPFCLTVDREGNDYLRTMMDDFSYEVLTEVAMLPKRLPQLYKRLTT